MNKKEIQHLYWRAGFGINNKKLESISSHNRNYIINKLFSESKSITPLIINKSEIQIPTSKTFKDPIKRQEFIEKSFQKKKELNFEWINRLVTSNEVLREKMTLFWSNHFVCKDSNVFHVEQYQNTIRAHALGNFREFAKAISKEAAMIKYLNNKQNRKEYPNENFARELMELFMLGEGSYTEKDIKESARAFTGYNHTYKGDFELTKIYHDNGIKTFLGKVGRYDGDDIIDIILEKKQCAKFISNKIYKYFVNDKPNQKHIKEMVNVFYPNYNIEKLMKYVFSSDWFYDEINIGSKIKSPIELLVGIQKTVPMEFKNIEELIIIQKLLGQILLNPPNVSGWKGGQYWIDSNSIMLRLKLASILLNDSYISTIEKDDFRDPLIRQFYRKKRHQKYFKVIPNWKLFNKIYSESSFEEIQESLIQSNLDKGTSLFLDNLDKVSKKDFCIQLMSIPEYQMC